MKSIIITNKKAAIIWIVFVLTAIMVGSLTSCGLNHDIGDAQYKSETTDQKKIDSAIRASDSLESLKHF